LSEEGKREGSAGAGEDKASAEAAGGRGGGHGEMFRLALVLGLICVVSGLLLAGVYSVTKDEIARSKRKKLSAALEEIMGAGNFVGEPELVAARVGGEEFEYMVLRGADGTVVAYAVEQVAPECYNKSKPVRLVVVASGTAEKLTLLGVRVLDSAETPGLGENIRATPASRSLFGMVAGRLPRKLVILPAGKAVVGRVEEDEAGGKYTVTVSGPDIEAVRASGIEVSDEGVFTIGEEECRIEERMPSDFLRSFSGIDASEVALSPDGATDAVTGATISSTGVVKAVREALSKLQEALAGNDRT